MASHKELSANSPSLWFIQFKNFLFKYKDSSNLFMNMLLVFELFFFVALCDNNMSAYIYNFSKIFT